MTTLNDTIKRFVATRAFTESITKPLEVEDFVAQPIIDVSPPRWHLAHTTWFFEEFLLNAFDTDFKRYHPEYAFLFNSYYNNVGPRWQREARGSLTRPTVQEIMAYRKATTEQVTRLLETGSLPPKALDIVNLGIEHECQHQELLLTDIHYILSTNPLRPVYNDAEVALSSPLEMKMLSVPEGIYQIGNTAPSWAWDNESPVHRVFLEPYAIANRAVTNGEWLQFMEEGGYTDFRPWLDEGWTMCQREQWDSPLYWEKLENGWHIRTLHGLLPVDMHAPVCHISFYEANAFATWADMRLPTEAEWEAAAKHFEIGMAGQFSEDAVFLPVHIIGENELQMVGGVWEWTNSAYLPYPNFRPEAGAIGEYNGKFMINQMVLRGGSVATASHTYRHSYRNFFPADKRWQFSGLRLARGR